MRALAPFSWLSRWLDRRIDARIAATDEARSAQAMAVLRSLRSFEARMRWSGLDLGASPNGPRQPCEPAVSSPLSAEQIVSLLGEAIQVVLDETSRPPVKRFGRSISITERLMAAAKVAPSALRSAGPDDTAASASQDPQRGDEGDA